MKPTGKQNALEWVIDFTRGIVTDNVPRKELNNFHLLAFTLFLFVFVANNIGLVTKIVLPSETTLWKSPTADPFVTLTLAFIMITLTHLFGVKKLGFKGYFVNSFLKPYSFMFPMKRDRRVHKLVNTCFTSLWEYLCGRSIANFNRKNDDKFRLVLIAFSNSVRDGLDRVLIIYRKHPSICLCHFINGIYESQNRSRRVKQLDLITI